MPVHGCICVWVAANNSHKMDGQFVAQDHSLEERLMHCSALSLKVPNSGMCLRCNYHVRHKSSP